MSNNKQSSVQQLVNSLIKLGYLHSNGFGQSLKVTEVINQAKAMHKEEIENAFVECWKANMPDGYECKLSAKEYYNETYRGNNEQQ